MFFCNFVFSFEKWFYKLDFSTKPISFQAKTSIYVIISITTYYNCLSRRKKRKNNSKIVANSREV